MTALKGMNRVLSSKFLRRAAQTLVCAGLAAMVGCHFPLSPRNSGSPLASRAILPDMSASLAGSEGVILAIGKPVPLSEVEVKTGADVAAQTLPTVTLANGVSEVQAPVPEALAGKSYGKMGIAIKWPDLSKAPYKAQFIPQAAQSIRVRVVGSDGKNRLSVMFFREDSPAGTLTQATAFFMPVEAGLLVEVRAYGLKKIDLVNPAAEPPVNKTIAKTTAGAAPYNPAKFPEYDLKGVRVLAEGFQFNVQVSLLAKTPVKVELDSSQLVAGIGGTASMNSGGDPYFNNFFSTARFAELWDPARVWYDKGQGRLFWVEYPSFKLTEDPKERDMVRMLNSDGLTGAKDDVPGDLVLSQVVGGDRTRTDENGDGNRPDCAMVNSINDIFWSKNGPGGNAALYIAESSSSFIPGRVRRILPPDKAGTVLTDPGFPTDAQTAREYFAVTGALAANDDVLAIDSIAKVVTLDNTFKPLLGSGTESISATESRVVDRVQLSSPQRVTALSSTDFLVLNGSSVVRVLGGSVRAKVGGGETIPVIDGPEVTDAASLSLSQLNDIKYDPVLKDSGNPVAYLADQGNSVVWVLKMGASLATPVKAKAVRVSSPRFLAVSPTGSTVYSMDDLGGITKINVSLTLPSSTESVSVGRYGAARGMSVGQDSPGGTDRLYIAFPTTITTLLVNSGETGARVTLFGEVDKNDLAVGDCANISSVLSSGINPVPAPVTSKRAGNLTKPTWVATDATGDIYISDTGNNRIRKVFLGPKGAPTRILSLVRSRPLDPSPTLTLDSPQGVDVDQWGNAFICDTNNNQVVVWRPCNGFFAEDVARSLDSLPRAGLLPVAGTAQGGINFDNINAVLVQLKGPKAIRVEKDATGTPSRRRVFFIDQGNRVRMLTPYVTSATAPTTGSRASSNAPICPSPAGVDSDPYFKYIISTIAGAGTGSDGPNAAQASLAAPSDLALDKDGYVYVADGSRVRRIDPITGSISTVYTAAQAITSISVDEVNKELYFTLGAQQSIRKVFLGN